MTGKRRYSLRLTGLATTTMLLALAGCDSTGPEAAEDERMVEDGGAALPMPAPETTPETILPERNAMPGAPPPPGDLPPAAPPAAAGSAQ